MFPIDNCMAICRCRWWWGWRKGEINVDRNKLHPSFMLVAVFKLGARKRKTYSINVPYAESRDLSQIVLIKVIRKCLDYHLSRYQEYGWCVLKSGFGFVVSRISFTLLLIHPRYSSILVSSKGLLTRTTQKYYVSNLDPDTHAMGTCSVSMSFGFSLK